MIHIPFEEKIVTGTNCAHCLTGEIDSEGYCDRCGRRGNPVHTYYCPVCEQQMDKQHECYYDSRDIILSTIDMEMTGYLSRDEDGDWWHFVYSYWENGDIEKLGGPYPMTIQGVADIIDKCAHILESEIGEAELRVARMREIQARL